MSQTLAMETAMASAPFRDSLSLRKTAASAMVTMEFKRFVEGGQKTP